MVFFCSLDAQSQGNGAGRCPWLFLPSPTALLPHSELKHNKCLLLNAARKRGEISHCLPEASVPVVCMVLHVWQSFVWPQFCPRQKMTA